MSFQDLEAGRSFASRQNMINGKQDASQAVASGIFQINTAVSTFQRLVNTLGTPKDTPELREKLHKTRLHIGQLVKDTSAKLKQASETDHHAEVSTSKKITDAKLAKDFQAVLKEFQKAQRLAAERETSYSPFVPQSALPASYTAGEMDASSDKSAEQRALLVERRQEVVLLDNEIAFNEAIIDEREQGLQEIQQQIGEVNEIFKDLAVLVHEQGTMIDDIGTHIENSQAATSQAKSHLVKAAKSQRSNSSLTLGMLAPGDIRNCASDSDHSTGSLIRKSSKMIKGKLKRSSQQQECGLLTAELEKISRSPVLKVSRGIGGKGKQGEREIGEEMSSSAVEAEAPDLVCQLDNVQGFWGFQFAIFAISIGRSGGIIRAWCRFDRGGYWLSSSQSLSSTYSFAMNIMLKGDHDLESVDSLDACIYAEIRTRIPDTISWDYNFEPAGSTPLTFTVKSAALKEAIDDLEWPGSSIQINLQPDPPCITFKGEGHGDLQIDFTYYVNTDLVIAFHCDCQVSYRYKYKFLRATTSNLPSSVIKDNRGSKLTIGRGGMLKVQHLVSVARSATSHPHIDSAEHQQPSRIAYIEFFVKSEVDE
ncbi:hypothetical protein GOBAR_DD00319 [Gossypium barbadense]|nr:hypothetical protein GOBAR_DD00319 [Gossypium barbadense]